MSWLRERFNQWRESTKEPGEIWYENYVREQASEANAPPKFADELPIITAKTPITRSPDERNRDGEYYERRVRDQERQSGDMARNMLSSITSFGPG